MHESPMTECNTSPQEHAELRDFIVLA